MGCNTSQEQKSTVAENGDIDTNNEPNKTARNSAKSEKSTKSAKSAKSDKLTNGHDDNKSNNSKDEGMYMHIALDLGHWTDV